MSDSGDLKQEDNASMSQGQPNHGPGGRHRGRRRRQGGNTNNDENDMQVHQGGGRHGHSHTHDDTRHNQRHSHDHHDHGHGHSHADSDPGGRGRGRGHGPRHPRGGSHRNRTAESSDQHGGAAAGSGGMTSNASKDTDSFSAGSYGLTRAELADKDEDYEEAVHYLDVLQHFSDYTRNANQWIQVGQDMWRRVDPLFKAMVPDVDKRYDAQRAAIRTNQNFINKVLSVRNAFMKEDIDYHKVGMASLPPAQEEKYGRVRSVLRQCVRDWAAEGKEERARGYGYILNELENVYPLDMQHNGDGNLASASTPAHATQGHNSGSDVKIGDASAVATESSSSTPPSTSTTTTHLTQGDPAWRRRGVKVLVPGCGLGRLPWELINMGFDAEGNEFSYYMLVPCYYILNW